MKKTIKPDTGITAMKVDKRTAEDIKHRLPCITHPACSSRETPRS